MTKSKQDNRTFGYHLVKDKDLIKRLRRWYTCSFCLRPEEIRPHAPFGKKFDEMEIYPLRLCWDCAELQEEVIENYGMVCKDE